MVAKPDIKPSVLDAAHETNSADRSLVPNYLSVGGNHVTVPDAHLLFNAEYARQNDDLVLTGDDGSTLVILDFFGQGRPVDLYSPHGAIIPFDLATRLAGPQAVGQYAQAGKTAQAGQAIGQVESLTGTATAKRTDGTVIKLAKGTLLYKGDVIQTGPNSEMGITFVDKTVFSLSAQARMVLNELVYNPAAKNNSMLLNLVEGSFVFVAGQVAGSGNMKVETPVATMGIRGTTVIVRVDAKDGTTYTSLAKDPDGTTGRFEIVSKLTNQVLGTVTETNNKWIITSADGTATELAKTTNDIASDLNAVSFIYNVYKASSDRINSGQDPVNQTPPTTPKPDGDRGDAPVEQPQKQASAGDPVPGSGVKTKSDGLGLVVDEPDGLGGKNQPPPATASPRSTPEPLTRPGGNERELDIVQNSAPEVDIAGTSVEVFQDQSTSISNLSVSDPDGGSLTVTLSAFSTVTLTQTTGLTFLTGDGVDDEVMKFTGTADAINAALSGLTYTPTPGNVGTGGFDITVDDEFVSTTARFTVTIKAAVVPTVSNVLLNVIEDGSAATGDFVVTDIDSTSHTFTFAASSPSGGQMTNNGNGTFTFDPLSDFQYLGDGDTEIITFDYTAIDEGGRESDVGQVFVTVTGVDDLPFIDRGLGDAPTDVLEGEFYSFVIPSDAFDDVDSSPLTVILADLPAWLTFDAATNTISGTPGNDDVGTHQIGITVATALGHDISDGYHLTVNPVNDAPQVNKPIVDVEATEDIAFSFSVPSDTFSDIDSPNLTLSATQDGGGALPAWLTFDSGTGTFSGTPLNDDTGVISIAVTADDGDGGIVSDVFDLHVINVNDAPEVDNPISNKTTTEDHFHIFPIPTDTFSDVDSATLTLSASLANGDPLPAWLNFNSATNTISGTAGNDDVGVYNIAITATDDQGASVTDTYVLGVNAKNDAPEIINPYERDYDAVIANVRDPVTGDPSPNEVLFGTDLGVFTDSGQALGSKRSLGVALGDLDGDGDLDAFFANTNTQPNTVFLNNGSGNFTNLRQVYEDDGFFGLVARNSSDVKLGDFDGDGDLDAFVTNLGGIGNEVYLNDGNADFVPQGANLGSAESLAVSLGDVNGDGILDAVVANKTPAGNKVYLGVGDGTFEDDLPSIGTANSRDVDLGDIDNDGDLDAIFANLDGSGTQIWLNNGDGEFTAGQIFPSSDDEVALFGDLDNDGDLDVILPSDSGGSNAVWFNNGGGTFTNSSQALTFPNAEDFALKDLDNDGDLDLFVVNIDPGNNPSFPNEDQVFFNDGTGVFTDSGQRLGELDGNAVALGELTTSNAPKALETTQGQPVVIEGIQFTDIDAGNGILTVTLSALNQSGTISVKEDVPSGVTDVTDNGTGVVTVTGTLDQLNTTFADPAGIHFMSNIDFLGVETIEIQIDDNGNTGAVPSPLTDTGQLHVTVKQPLPIDLSELGDTFITGQFADDLFGTAVSGVGDINNDGFDDVMIGAQFSNAGGLDRGYSTVIFGKAMMPSDIDAGAIIAADGFNASGIGGGQQSGASVSGAGDLNNDGIADIINGAVNGNAFGTESGEAYVRFGGQAFGNSHSFSNSLTTGNFQGFNLDGSVAFDHAGTSVSGAGDVTGDGIDDVLVGAPHALSTDGQAYLVKGGSTIPLFSQNLAGLNGDNGYVFNPEFGGGELGFSVAGAGDVDGDGINDVLFGAPAAVFGAVHLVFGGDDNLGSIDGTGSLSGEIDLSVLDGISGYTFLGAGAGDATGIAVAGDGDVDGDGFSDLLFSAPTADDGPDVNQGISYLVFGGAANLFDLDTSDAATDGTIDLLNFDATHGYKFLGRTYGDHRAGSSLDFAGDLNGDGYEDIIITTHFSDGEDGTEPGIGEIFIISGGRHNLDMLDDPVADLRDGIIDLDNLDHLRAEVGSGEAPGASYGYSVSRAGDVNGDGYDDVIVGEPGAGTNGQAVILFGGDTLTTTTHQGTDANDTIDGTANRDVIIGDLGDDHLNGNGGEDTIRGGAGDDVAVVKDLTFKKVDGGSGQDTLQFWGVDTIDLRAIADNSIESFEALSIEDGQTNTLTLGINDVFNLSESNDAALETLLSDIFPNSATIHADSGDTVQIENGSNGVWVENTGLSPLVPGFTLYDYGSFGSTLATVAIDDDASVVILPA